MSAESTFIPLDALRLVTPLEQLLPTSVSVLYVAKYHSECGGVNAAADAMRQLNATVAGREPYFSHRMPTHNRIANEEFLVGGLTIIPDRLLNGDYDFTRIPDGSIYVKTAHGGTIGDDAIAEEKGLHVVDLTCGLVDAEQKIGNLMGKKGVEIIYYGAREKSGVGYHPETRSFLANVNAKIHAVSSMEEFEALGLDPGQEYMLMNQTTMSTDIVGEMRKLAKERLPNVRMLRHQGCYATDHRQGAMTELAELADFNMVITSPESNNGGELINISLRRGTECMLIQSQNDIPWNRFAPESGIEKIGLSSAASCPRWLMNRTIKEFERRGIKVERLVAEDPEDPDETFGLDRANLATLQYRYRLWPSPREAEKVVGYNT